MQEVKRKGGEIPKIMIILDSAGNLATAKEIEDAATGSEKADMTRSKILKSIFRIIMTPLADLKIPFLFTNHTYQTQDFISRQVAGGGTGPEYAASIVLMLNKAQLKDGAEKVGIIVTAKPDKNRFAKPHPIKFHLDFTKGMNPYVGLEQFVSWEACGVGRGNKLTEKEFSKLSPADQEICSKFELNGETYYFLPKKLGKSYIIRHNGDEVPVKEFFSSRLFINEVLAELDERIIKPTFKFPETQDGILDMETAELTDINDTDGADD
jgi:hypothetical protein